jgi:hypothetical protein
MTSRRRTGAVELTGGGEDAYTLAPKLSWLGATGAEAGEHRHRLPHLRG